jgi:hypothetical protein
MPVEKRRDTVEYEWNSRTDRESGTQERRERSICRSSKKLWPVFILRRESRLVVLISQPSNPPIWQARSAGQQRACYSEIADSFFRILRVFAAIVFLSDFRAFASLRP